MSLVERVLPAAPIGSLADYERSGGGRGLEAARRLGPAAVVEELEAAGLRGRGGAGFVTGLKWRTVAAHASAVGPATVVVNGAEGEPATFKDRTILRRSPYAVLEGALIAALAVGADRAVVALKESFGEERDRVDGAIAELTGAGWCDGVGLSVASGPSEYLFGEETGLLEVLDGRPPFPRIAPPFRHGVDDMATVPGEPAATVMARPGPEGAPPTLVNNVETLANVPAILAEGPDWFRSLGTAESPGTVVCTIIGATTRDGVGEVPMGTPLSEAIDAIGGGARAGRRLVGALSGVANPVLPSDRLDTPLAYEAMQAAGAGLGAAGFLVFDDETDMAAVAAGVSRFLAIESCGQCTPCKHDGLALAEHLARVCESDATHYDLGGIADLVGTVADEARCFLASQHQLVLESMLRLFPEPFKAHVAARRPGVRPVLVAPIVDIVDGRAMLDEGWRDKRPDWTFEPDDSGKTPVERLALGGTEAPES